MSPFTILLLGHLVGDYLLQTGWMAANKSKKIAPLVVHSLVYTLAVTLFAWFGFAGLSTWAVFVIFISHIILDQRSFVCWWVKYVMRTPESEARWLSIVVDQVFHLLILALALQL